jgi:hypothetical protein
MTRLACPVACPIVWNERAVPACTRAGLPGHLPANDFPEVSPRSSAYPRGHIDIRFACPVGGSADRGVVFGYPLRCPFARPSLVTNSTPLHAGVPAKEKKKGEQPGRLAGGER